MGGCEPPKAKQLGRMYKNKQTMSGQKKKVPKRKRFEIRAKYEPNMATLKCAKRACPYMAWKPYLAVWMEKTPETVWTKKTYRWGSRYIYTSEEELKSIKLIWNPAVVKGTAYRDGTGPTACQEFYQDVNVTWISAVFSLLSRLCPGRCTSVMS